TDEADSLSGAGGVFSVTEDGRDEVVMFRCGHAYHAACLQETSVSVDMRQRLIA
ncbi:hypothetical protein KIPB_016925, partial [Kipferlia bialata]